MHHAACYCPSAALYEDLYRSCGEYARCGDPATKLHNHDRALAGWFRAFPFDCCAELARQLPRYADVTEPMKQALPRGTTLPSLRQMGEAAAHADGLANDGGEFQRLARFLLDWESFPGWSTWRRTLTSASRRTTRSCGSGWPA
jgi:hypothetical protein